MNGLNRELNSAQFKNAHSEFMKQSVELQVNVIYEYFTVLLYVRKGYLTCVVICERNRTNRSMESIDKPNRGNVCALLNHSALIDR